MLKYKKTHRVVCCDFIIDQIGLIIKDCEREYYKNPSNRKARKSGKPIDTEKMSDLMFERWDTAEQCIELIEQAAGLPFSKKICSGSGLSVPYKE